MHGTSDLCVIEGTNALGAVAGADEGLPLGYIR
jgi:hypothetical protein